MQSKTIVIMLVLAIVLVMSQMSAGAIPCLRYNQTVMYIFILDCEFRFTLHI